jgi:hypothetical protein
MKRIWIILLAVSLALVIALPAGAKKPDKPKEPDGAFKPVACQVDTELASGTFEVAPPKQFVLTPYTAYPGTDQGVLCLKVELRGGSLSDLRVRWLDYVSNQAGASDLYWARGKELRALNDGGTFSTGISLEGWTSSGGFFGSDPDPDGGDMTVVVMPKAKSDTAEVIVTIGIDHGG